LVLRKIAAQFLVKLMPRKTARRHGRGIKDLEEIRPSSLNHHNSNIRAQIIEEHRQSRADARIRTRLVRSLRATRDTKKHATDKRKRAAKNARSKRLRPTA